MEVVKNDSPYHDSLGYYFFYLTIFPHFTPNLSGYLMLQSKGLDIISNRDIRISISNLYENYNYLRPFEEERFDYNTTILAPAMANYRGIRSLNNDLIPENLKFNHRVASVGFFRNMILFEEFKEDHRMHGMIKDVEDFAVYLYNLHESVMNHVVELSTLLEEELKQRNS